MQMHGPPTDPATDRDLIWQIKSKGNEQLRHEFLSIYVPRIWELGLTVPDPALRLDQATGAISVPEENLHDARLKLAGAGLAESGRLGFEMMERDPGFGVSQFVENARYQHALAK